MVASAAQSRHSLRSPRFAKAAQLTDYPELCVQENTGGEAAFREGSDWETGDEAEKDAEEDAEEDVEENDDADDS